MLKFPKAVTAIKNAQGGMVWKLGERTGRRKYLRLPHHADCDAAAAARAKKYRDFHAAEVGKIGGRLGGAWRPRIDCTLLP